MKNYFALLVGLWLTTPLLAQQFLTPLTTLTGDAQVITQDDRTINGDIRMATMGPKGLISFRVKETETGTVHKFAAEDVKTLRLKLDQMAKIELYQQQTATITRLSNANFEEFQEREFIYYHQVAWPGKPDKYLLVQLLNEGWDSKIKVYDYPGGMKTGTTSINGVAVSGGDAKSFVVDYLGETQIVNKRNYEKEHFGRLFGNCPNVVALDPKDRDFNNFALHVFTFETGCE